VVALDAVLSQGTGPSAFLVGVGRALHMVSGRRHNWFVRQAERAAQVELIGIAVVVLVHQILPRLQSQSSYQRLQD
jgi:hypothetical protein